MRENPAEPMSAVASPEGPFHLPHLRPQHMGGAAGMVLGMVLVGLLPAFLTLRTVMHPGRLVITSDNPTPFGYTWSLTLWVVPVVASLAWLHSRRTFRALQRSVWVTVLTLALLGVLLDIVFGNTFFTFPNKGAVLGIYVYGFNLVDAEWVKDIPIEEFGFYLFGIAAALLIYLWADVVWFGRYIKPREVIVAMGHHKLLKLNWKAALLGGMLILAGILFKKLGPVSHEGFPGYFTFLIAGAFIPASMLFDGVRRLVNWRAYSFAALVMFCISMLWEATVAFPYQWWGYRPRMMLGLYVEAWQGLPVEEPFLWILVTFTTVIIFEAINVHVSRRMPDANEASEP